MKTHSWHTWTSASWQSKLLGILHLWGWRLQPSQQALGSSDPSQPCLWSKLLGSMAQKPPDLLFFAICPALQGDPGSIQGLVQASGVQSQVLALPCPHTMALHPSTSGLYIFLALPVPGLVRGSRSTQPLGAALACLQPCCLLWDAAEDLGGGVKGAGASVFSVSSCWASRS